MFPIEKLTWHVGRILPQVYDEAMSYYELLNTVMDKLNEVIDSSNDYFNKDLKTFVSDILTDWKSTGEFDAIINGTIFGEFNARLAEMENVSHTHTNQAILNRLNQTGSETEFDLSSFAKQDDLTNAIEGLTGIVHYDELAYVNPKFPPAPFVGVVGDGITDDSTAIQNLINAQMPLLFPPGKYKIKKTVNIGGFDFIGSGLATGFDIDGCDGFNVFDEGGRKVVSIGHFNVITTTDNCKNFAAFTSTKHPTQRTVGVKFSHIEIGGGGVFGAGFLLSDMFRLSIEHVGMTDCLNAVILEGQIVQASLIDVTSNANTKAYTTTLNSGKKDGLTLKGSSHSGSNQIPESVKTINCSFVGHEWGVNQNGCLFASYHGTDLDYNQKGGLYVGSTGGGCNFRDAWIANEGQTDPTIGVKIDLADFDRHVVVIDGVHISTLAGAHTGSIGIETASYKKSVTIKNCTVRGSTMLHGFYLRSPVESIFQHNVVWDGICTGEEIKIEGAQECLINGNRATRMTVHGDGSWCDIRSNMVGSLTKTGTNTFKE